VPGFAFCAIVAAVAFVLGRAFPLVGGPVLGIVFGIVAAPLIRRAGLRERLAPGIRFSSKTVLQTAIVLLGATLDIGSIARVSSGTLPVMLGTFAICLAWAWLIGAALRLPETIALLIGVGTAICGASAIAAVSAVIEADQSDIAYAISTIFLFNVIAVLVFPPIGHLLGFSQHAFGLWAGTAINDTSSVVAAGYVYGPQAGDQAVIVKLTRTLLIVPIVAVLTFQRLRRERVSGVRWGAIVPWFILWFLGAALVNSAGLIPAAFHPAIAATANYLIVVALVGVGLAFDLAQIRRAGLRPVLLGGILWVIIATSSVLLQRVTTRF
jgi:uncharacterized integral membrane protein (TIGR00698 family)